MNKIKLLAILLILISISAFSQGFYFDIGLGLGPTITMLNGINVSKSFDNSVEEVGVELGTKMGFGPIEDIPVYFIVDLDALGHRFEDSSGFLQFNSYLIGPGVVFYPLSFLQMGVSAGYSFVANSTSVPDVVLYKSKSGGATSISLAMDFGDNYNGVLVGCKAVAAYNILNGSDAEMFSTIVSFFVRSTHR